MRSGQARSAALDVVSIRGDNVHQPRSNKSYRRAFHRSAESAIKRASRHLPKRSALDEPDHDLRVRDEVHAPLKVGEEDPKPEAVEL